MKPDYAWPEDAHPFRSHYRWSERRGVGAVAPGARHPPQVRVSPTERVTAILRLIKFLFLPKEGDHWPEARGVELQPAYQPNDPYGLCGVPP